jgi:hypothetical protein
VCVTAGNDYYVMNGIGGEGVGVWSCALAFPKIDIHIVSIIWALQKSWYNEFQYSQAK